MIISWKVLLLVEIDYLVIYEFEVDCEQSLSFPSVRLVSCPSPSA